MGYRILCDGAYGGNGAEKQGKAQTLTRKELPEYKHYLLVCQYTLHKVYYKTDYAFICRKLTYLSLKTALTGHQESRRINTHLSQPFRSSSLETVKGKLC